MSIGQIQTINDQLGSQSSNFSADPFFQSLCVPNGNFANGSTYQANLHNIFSQISSSYNHGFYWKLEGTGSSGQLVNAIGLCRGDQEQDACQICLKDTISKLQQNCSNYKEAIGWSDFFMLRYANRVIVEKDPEVNPFIIRPTGKTTSDNQFNQAVNSLLSNLTSRVAAGVIDSTLNYAADNYGSGIYALVQCTPDLSSEQCSSCLETAIGKMPGTTGCKGMTGCRVLLPSCNLRYDTSPFIGTTPDNNSQPPLPPYPSPPGKGKGKAHDVPQPSPYSSSPPPPSPKRKADYVPQPSPWPSSPPPEKDVPPSFTPPAKAIDEMIKAESLQYDFATVRAATNNFSDKNKLGQGGFGAVYKGQLSKGQVVAVKRLSNDSRQGESEFKNEILLLAKLQHRNLVKLLGFCLEENERLLIFEFMPNGGLDRFIFDPIKRAQLNWEGRYKIIEGIARGLLYLHEDSCLKVIHRDLKASNILLDGDMNPKIADFGLARLFVVGEAHDTTSKIAGTYGYMAPEYVTHGRFSIKTDVFSFGVMILEIVSGQKNNSIGHEDDTLNLISIVWRNWTEGTPLNIVDPNLQEDSTSQITRCIHIGLLCVQEKLLQRPTMGLVVAMLGGYPVSLPVPSRPAFLFIHSATQSNMSSFQDPITGTLESNQSNNGMDLASTNQVTISELHPR
ncbi:hypothetical protein SLEP1_g29550 [Rubroshorea leprosula]|uniref:Cysteine-rich receptor-like protein kinase n=1 Tax=Rubroshorea leprosula TaxID=152421 RepID=A0AAV5K4B0_9ROSI|nr:hypothetical protein SLEP1_g29550 [Rubroshorea leprosula]